MSNTRIIDGIKYLQLCNENNLKFISLENNIYFTLRDIFVNISGIDYCMEANAFNNKLTDNICYEDRTLNFTYTNILDDDNYIDQLNSWLISISPYDFEYEQICNDPSDEEKEWYFNKDKLIKFNDWWLQFEELKKLIKIKKLHLSHSNSKL